MGPDLARVHLDILISDVPLNTHTLGPGPIKIQPLLMYYTGFVQRALNWAIGNRPYRYSCGPL